MPTTQPTPLAETLADFATGFDLKTSPERDRLAEKAKFHILDGIGVALASTTMEDGFAQKLLHVARGFGSTPACTIIGFRDRAAPPVAALMNGSLIHGCEYDDIAPGPVHSESFAVATTLALGEQRGLPGESVLEGFLVATEIALRLACGVKEPGLNQRGFHTTSILGTVGAAAGAARMMGLDASRAADAIALTASVTSGTNEGWNDGSGRNKTLQPGWAAMSGILAAQMAEAGYECAHTTLDGPVGLLAAHAGKDGWSTDPILDGLASTWKCLDITFKVYTAGGRSQALLDCTRELVFEYDIKPEEVESIELTLPSQWANWEFARGTWEKRYRPDTGYAMHGSWPCNVARMILSREVGVQHQTLAGVRDPKMLALADRVTAKAGRDAHLPVEERPTTVVINTQRGRFERTRAQSTGVPGTFSSELIVDKFSRNARLVLAPNSVDRLVDLVMNLEEVEDIHRITELLVA